MHSDHCAITTKIIPASNTRQTHVKARAAGRQVSIPYEFDLNAADNHEEAAKALINKNNWAIAELLGAASNEGMVWVPVPFAHKIVKDN